jgi:hypothetical protein
MGHGSRPDRNLSHTRPILAAIRGIFLFPSHAALSRSLARRCHPLVQANPDQPAPGPRIPLSPSRFITASPPLPLGRLREHRRRVHRAQASTRRPRIAVMHIASARFRSPPARWCRTAGGERPAAPVHLQLSFLRPLLLGRSVDAVPLYLNDGEVSLHLVQSGKTHESRTMKARPRLASAAASRFFGSVPRIPTRPADRLEGPGGRPTSARREVSLFVLIYRGQYLDHEFRWRWP